MRTINKSQARTLSGSLRAVSGHGFSGIVRHCKQKLAAFCLVALPFFAGILQLQFNRSVFLRIEAGPNTVCAVCFKNACRQRLQHGTQPVSSVQQASGMPHQHHGDDPPPPPSHNNDHHRSSTSKSIRLEAIATRLEAIAIRLEAIAIRWRPSL